MNSDLPKRADYDVVRELISRLDAAERLRLFEELEKEARRMRLRATLEEIRESARQHPISDDEIRAECETVRQELYDRKRREGRR